MNYLLWDIDGTLMLTNFAGVTAMKETIRDLYGVDGFNFSYSMSGRTDTYIARRAIEQIKGSCTKSDVETFIEAYAKRLPETLAERHGHLLPFVKETLAYTQAVPDVTNLLLTGNCEKAALAKLAHFGIDGYFDRRVSAFGEISELRDDLSRALWQKLTALDPEVTPSDAVVIGDTPHDITCADAIGVRALIVKGGSTYKVEDLKKYTPWKIIETLPQAPETLLQLIKE